MEQEQDDLLDGVMEGLSGKPKTKTTTPDQFLKGEKE